MIHKTAKRAASEVLRLLGRPRFFEISPGAPSARNIFNNCHTWRSLRPTSCAAVRTGSPARLRGTDKPLVFEKGLGPKLQRSPIRRLKATQNGAHYRRS